MIYPVVTKTLLFAAQEGGAAYSELHMAAGERAILRLSKEITQLDGALVLIDEVEAGLTSLGATAPHVASTATWHFETTSKLS